MDRKVSNSIKIKRDFLIVFCIVTLPFLFYLYKLVPENIRVWHVVISLNENGFFEFDYYIWLLFVKFFTLGIVSIWFLTCKQRWKNLLLFVAYIEIQKIVANVYFAHNGEFSYQSIWFTLLIFIPYYFSLIVISKKINSNKRYESNDVKINEEINEHLDKLSVFHVNDYKLINKELSRLNKSKQFMERKEYLVKLLAIRDRLTV